MSHTAPWKDFLERHGLSMGHAFVDLAERDDAVMIVADGKIDIIRRISRARRAERPMRAASNLRDVRGPLPQSAMECTWSKVKSDRLKALHRNGVH